MDPEYKNNDTAGSTPVTPVLQNIVRQLEDLVHILVTCEKKELAEGVSFEMVNKQLAQIRQDLDRLHEMYLETLRLLSLKESDIQEQLKTLPEHKEERRLFETLERLKKTAEEGRERAFRAMQGNTAATKQAKEFFLDEKRKKRYRKGKFKSVGGKEGWIPT